MTKRISFAMRILAIGLVTALGLMNMAAAQTPQYFLDDQADADNTALYYTERWHDNDAISWNTGGYYHTAVPNWGGWYLVNDAYKPTTSEYYMEAKVKQNFEFFSMYFNIKYNNGDLNSFTSVDWYEVRFHSNGEIYLFKNKYSNLKMGDFVGVPGIIGSPEIIKSATWSSDKNWHILKVYYNENSGEVKVWLDDAFKIQATVSGLTQTKNIAFFTYTDSGGDYVDFDDLKIYSLNSSPQPTQSSPIVMSKTGLVAEYHFDGDAKDSSGNGNDGTIYGATFVDGVKGQALKFDGAHDYVSIADTPRRALDFGATDSFTVELFAKFYGFTSPRWLIQKGGPNLGLPGYHIAHDANNLEFVIGDGTSSSNALIPINGNLFTGTWYHIVGVRDASSDKLRLYVNGFEVANIIDTTTSSLATSASLFVGSRSDGYRFDGIIDEVRIYNRALSTEEIKANYDSTLEKSPATTTTKSASAPTSPPATPALTIAQTARPTPVPKATPETSYSYIYVGIGGVVLLLIAIVALRRKGSSQVMEPVKPETKMKPQSENAVLEIRQPEYRSMPESTRETSVSKDHTKSIAVTSAYGYKGAAIQYKVKVENPTSEPVADIKVTLFVPDVFLLSEPTQNIAMLKPGESKTATFDVRPTGECGKCEISGKVVYYDYSTRKTQESDIPPKDVSIICPVLRSKEITEDAWRELVSKFAKAEESTKEIEMPAATLFEVISDIMRDMNLFMLPHKRTESSGLYRASARFYGEGVKGLQYAAQAEVIGGVNKSKLMLKAWAKQEDALVGFYHGILDEIEKRIHVKKYIDTPIVQNIYNIDNSIGTNIGGDVVAVRSNIGAGARKCPKCGRKVEANEKFCLECGEKL